MRATRKAIPLISKFFQPAKSVIRTNGRSS